MHTPLQEVQQSTTSTEFLEWRWYFAKRLNDRPVWVHYIAKLIHTVRQLLSKKKVDLEKCYITFGEPKAYGEPGYKDADGNLVVFDDAEEEDDWQPIGARDYVKDPVQPEEMTPADRARMERSKAFWAAASIPPKPQPVKKG